MEFGSRLGADHRTHSEEKLVHLDSKHIESSSIWITKLPRRDGEDGENFMLNEDEVSEVDLKTIIFPTSSDVCVLSCFVCFVLPLARSRGDAFPIPPRHQEAGCSSCRRGVAPLYSYV